MLNSPIICLRFIAVFCDETGLNFGAKDLEFNPDTKEITGWLTVGKGDFSTFCSLLTTECHALGLLSEMLRIEIKGLSLAETDLLFSELEQKAIENNIVCFAE
jgi:hypothetical protein